MFGLVLRHLFILPLGSLQISSLVPTRARSQDCFYLDELELDAQAINPHLLLPFSHWAWAPNRPTAVRGTTELATIASANFSGGFE
jgi:hypothetical protein